MNDLNFKIISTGSRGNCVIIENIMFDCGVPFKEVKDELYNIKYLILTHTHSDHIRPSTLKKIKQLFPRITVIGNYEVHQEYKVDIISNAGYPVETDDYTFEPFLCKHDVLCHGYVFECNNLSVIYATDTSDLKNAPKRKYDYFFIESNHDEKKVELILRTPKKYGYNAYAGAKRHMSTQCARAFYYTNRRDKNSKLIELHMSERFY